MLVTLQEIVFPVIVYRGFASRRGVNSEGNASIGSRNSAEIVAMAWKIADGFRAEAFPIYSSTKAEEMLLKRCGPRRILKTELLHFYQAKELRVSQNRFSPNVCSSYFFEQEQQWSGNEF